MEDAGESYWDLIRDIARLQGRMGEDLIAWATAYEAGGRAFAHTAETLALMADVGERLERYLEGGTPAGVQQAMQLLGSPWQAMLGAAGAPGTGPSDPFRRFWEAWTAGVAHGGPLGEGGDKKQP